MTTALRRITVSLPVEVDKVVVRLSQVMGKPQSHVITSLMAEMVPQLNHLANAIEESKKAPDIAMAVMLEAISESAKEFSQQSFDLASTFRRERAAK